MRGKSQSEFAHAVPKTSRPVGPWMNLTFPVLPVAGSRTLKTSRQMWRGSRSYAQILKPTVDWSEVFREFRSAINIGPLCEAFTKCEGFAA
jgi:hypothetical protein